MPVEFYLLCVTLAVIFAFVGVLHLNRIPVLFPALGMVQPTLIGIVSGMYCYVSGRLNNGDFQQGIYLIDGGQYLMAMVYTAITMFVAFSASFFGYSLTKQKSIKVIASLGKGMSLDALSWTVMFLAIGMIVLLHAQFGFRYIAQPRILYEMTRVGFGAQFFIMTFLFRLAFVMGMFSRTGIYVCLLAIGGSVFTGSKAATAPMLIFFAAYVIVLYYRNFPPWYVVLGIPALGFAVLYGLMAVTFYMKSGDLLTLVMGYLNEPLANFSILRSSMNTHFSDYFWGQMFLENNIISRIPRGFYSEKPIIFGAFRLSQEYFPEAMERLVGAPSFNGEGNWYSDFGDLGLVGLLVWKGLRFYLIGACIAILEVAKDPLTRLVYFGLMMFMAGMYLIAVPPSDNLLENCVLILVIAVIVGFQWKDMREA